MALVDLSSSAPSASAGSGNLVLDVALSGAGGSASAGSGAFSNNQARLAREATEVGVAEATPDARIAREAAEVGVSEATETEARIARESAEIGLAEQTVDARIARVSIEVAVNQPTAFWGIPLANEPTYVDQFFHDTRTSQTTGGATLTSGVVYDVIVEGNFNVLNEGFGPGGYWDLIMFGFGAGVRYGNRDAEFKYGQDSRSDGWPGSEFHKTVWEMDIGDGSGFLHYEPIGGQPGASNPNHYYRYRVTGQGAALIVRMVDAPLSDNSGSFRVTIYEVG